MNDQQKADLLKQVDSALDGTAQTAASIADAQVKLEKARSDNTAIATRLGIIRKAVEGIEIEKPTEPDPEPEQPPANDNPLKLTTDDISVRVLNRLAFVNCAKLLDRLPEQDRHRYLCAWAFLVDNKQEQLWGWNAAIAGSKGQPVAALFQVTDPSGTVSKLKFSFVLVDYAKKVSVGDFPALAEAVKQNDTLITVTNDITIPDTGLRITAKNVRIAGAAGGAKVTITVPYKSGVNAFDLDGEGVWVDNFLIDSKSESTDKDTANAIAGSGTFAVTNCVFGDLTYAVQCNQKPKGVLVKGCVDQDDKSIRAYFVWLDGEDITVVDCECKNSTREHAIRGAGYNRVSVGRNKLANVNYRGHADPKLADQWDIQKTALNLQWGQYACAWKNVTSGPAGCGPLGGGDGKPAERTKYVQIVGNTFQSDQAFIVKHGAEYVFLTGNTFVSALYDGLKIDSPAGVDSGVDYQGRTTRHVYVARNNRYTVPKGRQNIGGNTTGPTITIEKA